MAKKQRSYTMEFRINAVKMAQEKGQNVTARDLGVPIGTMSTWLDKARKGEIPEEIDVTKPDRTLTIIEEKRALERENKRLKDENAILRYEAKILEDAATFFAARQKKKMANS